MKLRKEREWGSVERKFLTSRFFISFSLHPLFSCTFILSLLCVFLFQWLLDYEMIKRVVCVYRLYMRHLQNIEPTRVAEGRTGDSLSKDNMHNTSWKYEERQRRETKVRKESCTWDEIEVPLPLLLLFFFAFGMKWHESLRMLFFLLQCCSCPDDDIQKRK